MRTGLRSGLAVLLLVAACDSGTSPTGGPLSGAWSTFPNPAGSGTALKLQNWGSTVTGTFVQRGIGPTPTIESGTVTGWYAERWRTLGLTLRYPSGTLAHYVGSLTLADRLEGTWSVDTTSYALPFLRAFVTQTATGVP